jgi:asparagine synthase (glutamine-hydrolysing)
MTDPSGRFTLIYNGEIYNADELKAQLQAAGIHQFKSTGDTELLLLAWSVWQEKTPEKLQGEFAFAVWDHLRSSLTLCRDRLGIKPLYYVQKKGVFAFASELTALHQAGLVGEELSRPAIDSFLAFGSVLEPWTIYREGRVLEAGTFLTVDARDFAVSQKRFWENPFKQPPTFSSLNLSQMEDLLRDAVTGRLVADAPLSIFLSGGIDSSCIAAAASNYKEEPTHTLCAFSDHSVSTDRTEAKRVADYLKLPHSELELTDSLFLKLVEKALAAYDQPSVDGINTFAVSYAAHRSGFKVALSGVGADELFCGYPHFHRAKYFAWLRGIPSFPFQVLARSFHTRMNEKLAAFLSTSRRPADFFAVSRALFLERDRKKLTPDEKNHPAC